MEIAPAAGPAPCDWDRILAQGWGRTPVLVTLGAPPLAAGDAFRLVETIARPFRSGLRFFVLPALRFRIGDADVRAPGDLLPDRGDATVADYLQRLHARLDGEPAWLEIEQPLIADDRAWSSVRDVLQRLWHRVGTPVQPLAARCVLGRYRRTSDTPALLLPLYGRVRLSIAPADGEAPAHEWTASPGELVYWPEGWQARECSDAGALVLRLDIVQATAELEREVRELAIAMMQPLLHPDGTTPAYPAGDPGDGMPGLPDALRGLVQEMPAFVRGPAFETALRVKWAGRRSAAALEPVPPRAEPASLQADDRVRMVPGACIVTLPMDEDLAVWAVNGHVFAVHAASAAEGLRQHLQQGGDHRVAALCGASGDGHDAGLRGVLDQLHAARAIVRAPSAGHVAPDMPATVDAAG